MFAIGRRLAMKNTLALSAAAMAVLITSFGAPAEAAYVVDLTQEVIGGVDDVVANGSGTIDTTSLTDLQQLEHTRES
jgi:hypothetical protein